MRQPTPPETAAVTDLWSIERALVKKALEDARYNKARAARTLGLTRTQLYVRLRRFGLVDLARPQPGSPLIARRGQLVGGRRLGCVSGIRS